MSFPVGGVKEIDIGDSCQDGYSYTTSFIKKNGDLKTNVYCKGGTVTQLDFLEAPTLMAEVPGGAELTGNVFSISARPTGAERSDSLILTVCLKGASKCL